MGRRLQPRLLNDILEKVTFTGSGGTTYEFLVGPTIVQARSASNTYVTTLVNNDVVTMNVYQPRAVYGGEQL